MDFDTFAGIPSITGIVERITIYLRMQIVRSIFRNLAWLPALGQSGNPVETLEGVEIADISELPIDSASGHLPHLWHTGRQ